MSYEVREITAVESYMAILREVLAKNLQAKTSWGRIELQIVIEASLSQAIINLLKETKP